MPTTDNRTKAISHWLEVLTFRQERQVFAEIYSGRLLFSRLVGTTFRYITIVLGLVYGAGVPAIFGITLH